MYYILIRWRYSKVRVHRTFGHGFPNISWLPWSTTYHSSIVMIISCHETFIHFIFHSINSVMWYPTFFNLIPWMYIFLFTFDHFFFPLIEVCKSLEFTFTIATWRNGSLSIVIAYFIPGNFKILFLIIFWNNFLKWNKRSLYDCKNKDTHHTSFFLFHWMIVLIQGIWDKLCPRTCFLVFFVDTPWLLRS